jgi:hypothetical protein
VFTARYGLSYTVFRRSHKADKQQAVPWRPLPAKASVQVRLIVHKVAMEQVITGIGSFKSLLDVKIAHLVDRSDLFKIGNLVGWNGEGTDWYSSLQG